jgi:hypothetical protein
MPPELAGDGGALLWRALGSCVCLFLIVRAHRGEGLFALLSLGPPRAAREPPLWGSAEAALAIAAWFACDIASAVLFAPFARTPGDPVVFILSFTVSKALACGFIALLVKRLAGQPLSALGLAPAPWGHFLLAVVFQPIVFVPITFLGVLWNAFLAAFGHQPELQEPVRILAGTVRDGDLVGFLSYALAAVVITPLAEEILFRGLLFGWLRRSLGAVAAALVSGALFAAVHFSLTALAQLVILGVFLAYLYQRSGSLWVAAFFHAVFNAASIGRIALGALAEKT